MIVAGVVAVTAGLGVPPGSAAAAPGLRPGSSATVGVDPTADGALLRAWNLVLAPTAPPAMGFTGDLTSTPCVPGGSAPAYRAAQLETINAVRSIAGVAPVLEDPAWTQVAQAAAVIVAADGSVSAVRTGAERCYTPAGADGSVRALQDRFSGPTNPAWYAADYEPGLVGVPRRRALLCPSLDRVGLGNAPDANAVVVRAAAAPAQVPGAMRDGFVAWPNAGQVPLLMLDATMPSSRMSLHLPVGSLTAGAVVRVSAVTGTGSPGAPVTPTAVAADDGGECQPVVSYVPSRRPVLGETWTVSVSGLVVAGVARTVSYTHRFSGLTTDTPFVAAAYQDFLGRPATIGERDQASANVWAGQSRSVLLGRLVASDEWLTQIVRRMYLDTLGREPDPGGLATWVQWIRSGRFTVAQAAGLFYSSEEFYLGLGGGTLTTWVTALYTRILGRAPDPGGLTFWVGYAGNPAYGRGWVAAQFYQSLESRLTRVAQMYRTLLGRGPDPVGWPFWAEVIRTSGDLTLAVGLAGSLEYDLRAWARF